MNPRCPTDTLTDGETQRLRDLAKSRGPKEACRLVGLSRETFNKAGMGLPVSRLTAQVIRGSLDRI